jgi:hypothetical protein
VIAVSPSVRWVRSEDVTLLFDLASGEFLAFDGVASVIWSALADRAHPEPLIGELASIFDASTARIAADVEAFRNNCVARGLLVNTTLPIAEPELRPARLASFLFARLPATLHAAAARSRLEVALRLGGFPRAYGYARAATGQKGVPHTERLRDHELETLGRAFVRAEGVFVHRRGTRDCLARSLALFLFLRERGVPASHVVGLTPRPFAAHAWVEIDEVPFLEHTDGLAAFHRLAVLC